MLIREVCQFIHHSLSPLRLQGYAFLGIILLSMVACGTSSFPPAETATASPTVTIINHQTTLGMDISSFLAAYGKPLPGSEPEKGYHFGMYGMQTHDMIVEVAWSSPAPYTSRVDALLLNAPPGTTWNETTAIHQCLAFAPADAIQKGQRTDRSDGTIEQIYQSSTLAKQLPTTSFFDRNQHPIPPGTFYMLLPKDSDQHIFACTIQTGE